MPTKIIVVNIIVFIIGFIIGIISVFLYLKINMHNILMNSPKFDPLSINGNLPINNNFSKIKNTNTKILVGVITSFNDNKLVIKITPTNNSGGVKYESNIIKVNDKTKFISMIQKDMNIFQKEMKEFQNISADKIASSTPPSPFIEKEISRDSFTVGKLIVIKLTEEVSSTITSVIAESVSLLPERPKIAN